VNLTAVGDCRIADLCTVSFLWVGGVPNPDEDTFIIVKKGAFAKK
jgi:hypothetical protein